MRRILPFFLFLGTLQAGGGTMQYSYDEAGRLVKVEYPSGGSIIYAYDPAGNLLSRTTNSTPSSNTKPSQPQPPHVRAPKHGRSRQVTKHSAL